MVRVENIHAILRGALQHYFRVRLTLFNNMHALFLPFDCFSKFFQIHRLGIRIAVIGLMDSGFVLGFFVVFSVRLLRRFANGACVFIGIKMIRDESE
jgi:hypothetical protein